MIAFKIDENLPAEVGWILKELGHDALTVLDQRMGGRPDEDLARVCREEGRAIFTLDLDFANILRYPPSEHRGIVVLRLPSTDKPTILAAVREVAPLLATLPVDRRLIIIEEGRVRVRS